MAKGKLSASSLAGRILMLASKGELPSADKVVELFPLLDIDPTDADAKPQRIRAVATASELRAGTHPYNKVVGRTDGFRSIPAYVWSEGSGSAALAEAFKSIE